MRASDTPVWIIGGGKTAMDTAHALITEYPGREVNLVAGSGTFFIKPRPLLPCRGPAMVARQARERSRPGSGPSFRRDQRDRCRELVPRYIRHVVNPRDRQLPPGRAVRIGEQDDRRRPERRDHGPLRGCRRPQRRNRSGVPQRSHQGDPAGQLDRELHRILHARRPPLRALRFRQRVGGLDSAAFCHTPFDVVHGLLPDAPAVLGQDQGRPAV